MTHVHESLENWCANARRGTEKGRLIIESVPSLSLSSPPQLLIGLRQFSGVRLHRIVVTPSVITTHSREYPGRNDPYLDGQLSRVATPRMPLSALPFRTTTDNDVEKGARSRNARECIFRRLLNFRSGASPPHSRD